LAERKDQIRLVPSGGARWIAMNTTIPPFGDVAVIVGFNREAMRLAYGGELSGDIPTHFLPPGVRGFNEAGGLQGHGLDFMSRPRGDPQLAALRSESRPCSAGTAASPARPWRSARTSAG
jgi:peptide/nickel transport system substrate-binding protein